MWRAQRFIFVLSPPQHHGNPNDPSHSPTTFSSIVNNLSTKQSTICEHASRTCFAPADNWSDSSSFLISWNICNSL